MAQDVRSVEAGLIPDPTDPSHVPLSPELATELRDALTDAGYTYDQVSRRLGATAHAALLRNETVPARQVTADGSPLSTLVRLWLLQLPVPAADFDAALPGLAGTLTAVGLVERSGPSVRALVDVRPYAEDQQGWWVVSDLTPGMDGPQAPVASDQCWGSAPRRRRWPR